MSSGAGASLAEQRRVLREQLVAQRQVLARDLVAGVSGGYPRSVTLRWLMQEPELVARVIERVAGGRVAAALPTALLLARALARALPGR